MKIEIHPHARGRMANRGATDEDIHAAIEGGERLPARHGRTLYRRNLPFGGHWRGKRFDTKQLEVYTVQEGDTHIVVTVIVKYF